MGLVCVVKSCPSGRKSKNKKNEKPQSISYFRPSTLDRLKKWKNSLGIELKATDCVCHLHFKEEHIKMYEKFLINGELKFFSTGKKKLRDEALPTIEHQFNPVFYIDYVYEQSILEVPEAPNEMMDTDDQIEDHLEQPPSILQEQNVSISHHEPEPITSLQELKNNILEFAILPPSWLYVDIQNGLEFMRMDVTTRQTVNHLRVNEDTSITVIFPNNDELVLSEKINSFSNVYAFLKSVERWPLCVGTQLNNNKYSKMCKGIIVGDERYKRNRANPRCKSCRVLRNRLLRRKENIRAKKLSTSNSVKQCKNFKLMKIGLKENICLAKSKSESESEAVVQDEIEKVPTDFQNAENACLAATEETNTKDVKQPNIDDSSVQTSVSSKERTRKVTSRVVKTESNTRKQPVIMYDCGLCTEKVEKDKLCDHVKSHETNNCCGICSLGFKDWETMLYHRISHLKNPNFICHICLSVFQAPISLEYHYNVKHLGKIEDSAKCRECNKDYVTLENLRRHRRYMHHDSNKIYRCKECSEVFRNPNALQYHKLKSHVGGKMWFCNECDYKSKFNASLWLHKLRMHTAEKVRCKLCRRLFKDESRLKLHKCQYSTHSIIDDNGIDQTYVASIICPVCGIMIEGPKKMAYHLTTHSDKPKYKCDRCDATYKTRAALRVHLNKHDGVRAYMCEYCPATFWAPSTLVVHRRVHTGERPYVCTVCDKGFTINRNLKAHMRVHGVFNLIKKKVIEEDSVESVQECT